jgi:formate hydrogenlyase transcriptional activator
MTISEGRYRTLLDASSVVADQPTIKAVLSSLRSVLSSTSRLHGADLYVLEDDGANLRLLDCDKELDAPGVKIGSRIPCTGVAAEVLEQQKPVFLPDVSQEMSKIPDLALFAAASVGRSTYLFPVSTYQKKYGFLAVTKSPGQQFLAEDVELLGSMASHVAVALEGALARDRAEQYQRELASERDRLRLVLDMNNHVAKLNIDDVLRSASTSIRRYFRCDSIAFWVLKEETGRLQKVLHDFPGGNGRMASVASADLSATELNFERLRQRAAEIWSVEDFDKLPATLREPLQAESIKSLALVCLATENRPIGLLSLGSRRAEAFGQQDLDLLSQVGIQISLALDNALAYGRLDASATRLEGRHASRFGKHDPQ